MNYIKDLMLNGKLFSFTAPMSCHTQRILLGKLSLVEKNVYFVHNILISSKLANNAMFVSMIRQKWYAFYCCASILPQVYYINGSYSVFLYFNC